MNSSSDGPCSPGWKTRHYAQSHFDIDSAGRTYRDVLHMFFPVVATITVTWPADLQLARKQYATSRSAAALKATHCLNKNACNLMHAQFKESTPISIMPSLGTLCTCAAGMQERLWTHSAIHAMRPSHEVMLACEGDYFVSWAQRPNSMGLND